MPSYYLSSHLHHCCVDGGVVLLDTKTKQYFALPREYQTVFRSVVDQDFDGAETKRRASLEKQQLQALIEIGVLTDSAAHGRTPAPASRHASQSISLPGLPEATAKIALGDFAAFALAVTQATFQLRWATLEHTIGAIREGKLRTHCGHNHGETALIANVVATFRRLRLWAYTAEGACLFDSLVLANFLQRHDIASTVFIGVRTKPFSAHAWVQWGELLLNDTVERVVKYKTILTL